MVFFARSCGGLILVTKEDILRRNLQPSVSWMLVLQYNSYFVISEFIPHAASESRPFAGYELMIEIGFTLGCKSQNGFFFVILA